MSLLTITKRQEYAYSIRLYPTLHNHQPTVSGKNKMCETVNQSVLAKCVVEFLLPGYRTLQLLLQVQVGWVGGNVHPRLEGFTLMGWLASRIKEDFWFCWGINHNSRVAVIAYVRGLVWVIGFRSMSHTNSWCADRMDRPVNSVLCLWCFRTTSIGLWCWFRTVQSDGSCTCLVKL